MALRPRDVMSDPADEKFLRGIEARIDTMLKEHFAGKAGLSIDLIDYRENWRDKARFDRVRPKLVKLYQKAGWKVTWNEGDCQRDGAWCSIVLTPRGET